MNLLSKEFIIILGLAAVSFIVCPVRWWRKYALFFINLAFLYFCSPDILSLLPFAAFILTGFILLKWIERTHSGSVLKAALIITVLVFVYLKQYPFFVFFPPMGFFYTTVGLSYVLFRLIHIFVDVREKAIKEGMTFLDYVNYTCFFLSFLSGPIQRYQEFTAGYKDPWRGEIVSSREVLGSILRFVKGYVKITALASISLYLHEHISGRGMDAYISPWSFVWSNFFYFLYLFMNFSGYMDIVIAFAFFLGFHLPENFDRPYLAKNLIDFWARWHMTLSNWFKLYVFNPIIRSFVSRWPHDKLLSWYGVAGYFITFFLIGIWHSSSLLGLLLGVLLAVGVTINKFYEMAAACFLDKKTVNRIHSNYLFSAFSTGLTLSYISLALCTIWADAEEFKVICQQLGLAGIIQGYLLSSIGIMVLKILGDGLGVLIDTVKVFLRQNKEWAGAPAYLIAVVGLIYIVLISFMVISNDAPDLVYKGF